MAEHSDVRGVRMEVQVVVRSRLRVATEVAMGLSYA